MSQGLLFWSKKLPKLIIAICMLMLFILSGMSQASIAATLPAYTEGKVKNSSTIVQMDDDNYAYLPMMLVPREESIVGVQMNYISYTRGLTQLAKTQSYLIGGAPIFWSDIEATKGTYDWSGASASEIQWRRASSEGFFPVGNVRSTPSWAQLYSGYYCGPMQSQYFDEFAEFMRQLVSRYSVPPYNVKYWEIWNEPDVDHTLVSTDSSFGCWGKSSDTYYGGGYYANMLKVVYPAIKSANPDAQVLVGGLLLDCNPDKPGINCISSKFFEGIVRNGGAPYFDGVSYHAYEYFMYTWELPEDDRYEQNLGHYKSNGGWSSQWNTTGPVMIEKANYLKSILAKYGVSGKYLMNTEDALNCSVCTGELVPPYNENPTPAFETTKAYYITQAYTTAKAIGLKGNLWYSLEGWSYYNTGLLNSDLSEREGFVAFGEVSEKLAGVSNLGSISSAEITPITGLTGYKFSHGNKIIWVVWSLDGEDHAVTLNPVGTLAAITDSLGVAQTLSTSITITIKPLYIEWTQ